jgi:hypothetical protein
MPCHSLVLGYKDGERRGNSHRGIYEHDEAVAERGVQVPGVLKFNFYAQTTCSPYIFLQTKNGILDSRPTRTLVFCPANQ